MNQSSKQFGDLLQHAVALIAYNDRKSRQIIYDELGYAINRAGASPVQYWAYRNQVPAKIEELEDLARVLVQRGGLRSLDELRAFLNAGNHLRPQALCRELFPPVKGNDSSASEDLLDDDGVPFIVGPPILNPRRFYGRATELQRVYNALRGRTLQHTAITGLPRSGKTSLMLFVSKITGISPRSIRPDQVNPQVPRGHIQHWVFITFQDPRNQTPTGFFDNVLQQLGLPSSGPVSLSRYTDILVNQLHDNTIILLDEIQVALANSQFDLSFWGTLRSLGGSLLDGRLGYIISSQKNIIDLTMYDGEQSPFLNIFGHHIAMAPFTEEEARQLIASSPIPFDPADIDWIITTSNRWPAPLQALCSARWRSLQEGQAGEAWKTEALQAMKSYHHLFGAA